MSNLADLLSLVLNVIFIFATVSYVTSSATNGLFALFKVPENLLLRGVKELLSDDMFTGLAREIYNNVGVNPRATGTAETEAQLGYKPASIDSKAFAVALLEVLHVVPTPVLPAHLKEVDPAKEQNEETRIKNAIDNATTMITDHVANSEDPKLTPERRQAAKQMTVLVTNMIKRHGADRNVMEAAVAAWFEFGMAHVSDSFRKFTQLTNFTIAFIIAVLLDLQPIPIGGFGAGIGMKGNTPASPVVANYIPIIISIFEWSVVATSALFGAQFWFSILKSVTDMSKPEDAKKPEVPPAGATATGPSGGPNTGGSRGSQVGTTAAQAGTTAAQADTAAAQAGTAATTIPPAAATPPATPPAEPLPPPTPPDPSKPPE